MFSLKTQIKPDNLHSIITEQVVNNNLTLMVTDRILVQDII